MLLYSNSVVLAVGAMQTLLDSSEYFVVSTRFVVDNLCFWTNFLNQMFLDEQTYVGRVRCVMFTGGLG